VVTRWTLRRHSFRRHRPEGLVHRRIRGHQRRCSRTGGRRRAPTDHAEPRHRNPAPPLRKTRRCSGPTYGIRRRCVPRSVAGRSTWSWTLLPSQRITWLRTLSYSPAGQGSTSSLAPPPRTRNPLRGCRFWNQTALRNPFWQYSREKIAFEDLLVKTYRQDGLPATIIRPSHTYDQTMIALTGGWTDIARMRAGKPVVVHGDGTSLWTVTHSTDVAKALVGLLGLPQALGGQLHYHLRRVPAMEQDLRTLRRSPGVWTWSDISCVVRAGF
jgi:hypothetical protein